MFFPLFLLLIFHELALSQNSCSSSSFSYHGGSSRSADCSKLGLQSLPTFLPTSLESLNVSGNQILVLNVTLLPISFPSLKILNLSSNGLCEFLYSNDSVKYSKSLRSLVLRNNSIGSLRSLSLSSFPHLRILDVSENKIKILTSKSSSSSSSSETGKLSNLTHLFLRGNRILLCKPKSLNSFPSLQVLDLSKNKLSSFPKDLFSPLRHLRLLELNKNKFVKIEGLSFHGLVRLETLELKRNAIEYLSDGAFFDLKRIKNLNLERNSITSVDKGWLYGLKTLEKLNLSHNKINYIASDAWDFLGVLVELDLKYNQIQILDKESFKSLPSLTHLFLQNNQISHLEDNVFSSVSSLLVLALDGNDISYTIEDGDSPFAGLSHLVKLSLSRNHIKSIGKKAFRGSLNSLTDLDLRSNIISTLEENPFSPFLPKLKKLALDSKSLLCDCYLRWFSIYIVSSGILGTQEASCIHPEGLVGKKLFQISSDSYLCDDFPKPYILEQPETQITLRSHNLTLKCRAASTSPANMSFEWKFDSLSFENLHPCSFSESFSSKCLTYLPHSFDGKGREITSSLHLYNLTYNDAGVYQCIVSNRFGATYSQKANITVYVYPSFLVTPEDIIVQKGSSATLKCAGEGVPAPKVSWNKDHGSDFPAASERRIVTTRSFIGSQENSRISVNSFVINNVKAIDMGIYTCTASNPAGSISWNISLSVLETPDFVKPMVDKSVNEGDTAVIDCSASGSPKPNLSWTKNGVALLATERHFLAADNQLLIIVKAEKSDAGRYECTISNQLGSESQSSTLQVNNYQIPENDPTTSIIVIAVVCCVIGTSLVWVVIIFKVRKYRSNSSSSPGEEIHSFVDFPTDLTDFDIKAQFRRNLSSVSCPHLNQKQIPTTNNDEKDSGTGDSKRSFEKFRDNNSREYVNVPLCKGPDEYGSVLRALRKQGGGESTISLSEFEETLYDKVKIDDEEDCKRKSFDPPTS